MLWMFVYYTSVSCLQYFCAFNYIIYSKLCTAEFNRFYDFPDSYIVWLYLYFVFLHFLIVLETCYT